RAGSRPPARGGRPAAPTRGWSRARHGRRQQSWPVTVPATMSPRWPLTSVVGCFTSERQPNVSARSSAVCRFTSERQRLAIRRPRVMELRRLPRSDRSTVAPGVRGHGDDGRMIETRKPRSIGGRDLRWLLTTHLIERGPLTTARLVELVAAEGFAFDGR